MGDSDFESFSMMPLLKALSPFTQVAQVGRKQRSHVRDSDASG
jgi:hypothetical protein